MIRWNLAVAYAEEERRKEEEARSESDKGEDVVAEVSAPDNDVLGIGNMDQSGRVFKSRRKKQA